jgi:hypothetical protein
MSPCNPNDVSFPSPSGPTGPAIPGLGIPFSLPVPAIPYPDGFPEDLLGIMNRLQMLIPPGALKPQLNANFGKDIYDGIMKLLDQFMPFLMLYKFFLPILNLIICIIEVLCALMNPFALISALNRLFTQCIPEFLNLFPIFALILMIISLLLLLLALIEYIIAQILKFIRAILRNINALVKAFQSANATSVITIAKKLGSLLCIFQNLFVLLSLFAIIIQVIKDILSLVFSIPPCEGGGPGSTDGCCAATYCPTIVQGSFTNETGTFQYLPEAGYQTNIALGTGFLTSDLRQESWQLYDASQSQAQAFQNIVNAFDVNSSVVPKPIFFPTDAKYDASTPPGQAAYTMDLRMYYNPSQWGRAGNPEFIRFKDCIVLKVPTQDLTTYNNGTAPVLTGVLSIAGGLGYLDDGVTKLTGFAADGVTPISSQATLNNFIHRQAQFAVNPILQPTDGYTFSDIEYTFKPNLPVLLQKNLVNMKCMPAIALNSAFLNNVMFSQITFQSAALNDLVNSKNGRVFPDPAGAQECLTTAISNLRSNMTIQGVAEFQATCNLCLGKLSDDTKEAILGLVGIGFNPCESEFSLTPSIQFTTEPIKVTVNINENNGLPITSGIPNDVAANIAKNISATPTFGSISPFSYDGYQAFVADLTSHKPGKGQIMISFQNQVLCTNTLSTDGITPPSHTLQALDYEFIFAGNVPSTGEGDTLGTQPLRDAGDISKDKGQ